ncbi:MAG: hypothetical protein M1814_005217 [Vezdaea aestivalis]|nr:MAG: hypothetical protein M1814_005217 [Vezdaea aestivalis]
MRMSNFSAAVQRDGLVQSRIKGRKSTVKAGTVRRSQRLIAKRKESENLLHLKTKSPIDVNIRLSSLLPSFSHKLGESSKRKRLSSNVSSEEEASQAKKPRTLQTTDDPVEWWAEHQSWPDWFKREPPNMGKTQPTKGNTILTHSERLAKMAEHGIFTKRSPLVTQESKDLCRLYLKGNRTPSHSGIPCYPLEKVSEVLERVAYLNEARLQRDITPWIVPSAENLILSGQLQLDYIGEEIFGDWTRCTPMGNTKPKPDYVAGLQRKAFSETEIERLQNYTTPQRPSFFTPNLCFPFLICEAKIGQVGIEIANRQNIHSASIAVAAIFSLFKSAFGETSSEVKTLYGRILVFTVSHDNSMAKLYGHYGVANDKSKKLEFYRHCIKVLNFGEEDDTEDGDDRFKTYNFVRNVYEKFVPDHLKRIQDAVKKLGELEPRTGLLFSISNTELEETDSQDSQDETFPPPSEDSELLRRIEQMEADQKGQIEQMKADQKRQIEQVNADQQQKDADQKRQMEQMKADLQQKDLLLQKLRERAQLHPQKPGSQNASSSRE